MIGADRSGPAPARRGLPVFGKVSSALNPMEYQKLILENREDDSNSDIFPTESYPSSASLVTGWRPSIVNSRTRSTDDIARADYSKKEMSTFHRGMPTQMCPRGVGVRILISFLTPLALIAICWSIRQNSSAYYYPDPFYASSPDDPAIQGNYSLAPPASSREHPQKETSNATFSPPRAAIPSQVPPVAVNHDPVSASTANHKKHSRKPTHRGRVKPWQRDAKLADELAILFQGKTVLELGVETGFYSEIIKRKAAAVFTYEGMPSDDSSGSVPAVDVTVHQKLEKCDWVLAIEAGSQFSWEYELAVIDNIRRHANDGVVLSWASIPQKHGAIVNRHSNHYVKTLMQSLGWFNDLKVESRLRHASSSVWFGKSLMVFRSRKPK